jgi:hypothetical protein
MPTPFGIPDNENWTRIQFLKSFESGLFVCPDPEFLDLHLMNLSDLLV